MIWIRPQEECNLDNDVETVTDHVFSIVKHTNTNFQVVSGFCEQSEQQPSVSLAQWQASGNPYCAQEGFGKSSMLSFLELLRTFSSSAKFDAPNFAALFNTRYNYRQQSNKQGGVRDCWPSFTAVELDEDAAVDGFGCHVFPNAVERIMMKAKLTI
jgi:hypothetical protein